MIECAVRVVHQVCVTLNTLRRNLHVAHSCVRPSLSEEHAMSPGSLVIDMKYDIDMLLFVAILLAFAFALTFALVFDMLNVIFVGLVSASEDVIGGHILDFVASRVQHAEVKLTSALVVAETSSRNKPCCCDRFKKLNVCGMIE